MEKSGGAGGGSNPDGAEQQPVVLRETDKRHKYRYFLHELLTISQLCIYFVFLQDRAVRVPLVLLPRRDDPPEGGPSGFRQVSDGRQLKKENQTHHIFP